VKFFFIGDIYNITFRIIEESPPSKGGDSSWLRAGALWRPRKQIARLTRPLRGGNARAYRSSEPAPLTKEQFPALLQVSAAATAKPGSNSRRLLVKFLILQVVCVIEA